MGKRLFAGIAVIATVGIIAGCSVNTKLVERERVDQDLSCAAGNRGYLMGTPPPVGERKTTRKYFETLVEIAPVEENEYKDQTAERMPAPQPSANYNVYAEPQEDIAPPEPVEIRRSPEYTDYTVQKGDTLQKISNKMFGTTKKWKKIFEANKDILRSPDKLRPGMKIRIPTGEGAQIKGNEFIK